MKQQSKKREWITPELVVLVRSHPEEAVLVACKGNADGPLDGFGNACLEECGALPQCDTQAAS